jgi:RNA polymerase sigma-70 factor (ECF subfamily)
MEVANRVLSADPGSGRMVAPAVRMGERAGHVGFEAVFHDHYRRLVRSLALACGSEDLAADVVQQAFVQLWADWPRISRYESPATWVARVAISRLRDHERSVRRLAAALLRLGRQAHSESVSPGDRLDITAALARLPLRQRLAVVLYYLDDRPISQVAGLMGVSEGTVNRHLFRAREALRSYLMEA